MTARRFQIEAIRHRVLELHRTIIEVVRQDAERVDGRLTPHEMLDRLMNDAAFAWLHPLSALIVRVDEWLDAGDAPPVEAEAWIDELRTLLTPDPDGVELQRRYADLLQRSPDVVLAHAAVQRLLG